MKAQERLWLTAGKDAVVAESDKRAAFLYAAVGDEIPASAAERFGIVDGRATSGGRKERQGGGDKERKDGADKDSEAEKADKQGAGGGPDEGASRVPHVADGPDDLTLIKGIGPATAAKLNGLGITTFRQLAAAPTPWPDADALGSDAEWQSWIAQAAELAGETGKETGTGSGLTINKRRS